MFFHPPYIVCERLSVIPEYGILEQNIPPPHPRLELLIEDLETLVQNTPPPHLRWELLIENLETFVQNTPPSPIGTNHGGLRNLRLEILMEDLETSVQNNPPPYNWNFSWGTLKLRSRIPRIAPPPPPI